MIEEQQKAIAAEKLKAENEKKTRELAHAYKRLFASSDGKLVLKDLEFFCGQNKSSVCEQSPNPHQTMFAEGKRRVFLRINSKLNYKENEND